MKDTFNADTGYLGKYRGIQTEEQHHRAFSNLVLKGKLCKAVRYVSERKNRVFLQPNELSEDCTGTINKTATLVLEGKHPHKKIPSCFTLETYDKTPIFIPVKIMDDTIESVARKLSRDSGPGGTDSEALHGWLLKFGEDRKILRTSVEILVEWISNGSMPWAACLAFMSGLLIAL